MLLGRLGILRVYRVHVLLTVYISSGEPWSKKMTLKTCYTCYTSKLILDYNN